ncbi:MarR family winged helix-turn-helix transcriptional regulator [Brevibacillus sp. B_LB10_24]|uniref:MarR family winged helix-turn-helix transcriptional regulator n=1 Tax=Brevibacillus sp. B_LB10_24 TaxID=3380645 RepID=UPI0038B82E2B
MDNDNSDHLTWEWNSGPIGRTVKVAYVTLRREVEAQLKPIGITHTQWSVLGIIHYFPGITSSELEQILLIERPSVTSLINGLVKNGWAIRRDHPTDGRYKQIFLTDEGTKLAIQTQDLSNIVDRRVREGMTPEEFETLKKLLKKMIGLFK